MTQAIEGEGEGAGVPNAAAARRDLPTVIGLAALAYAVSAQLHEGLGHGGACLAVGGRLTEWGAYYVECDTHALPGWADRVVQAAGSTTNLIAAVAATLLLRTVPRTRPATGLFLWLLVAINLFTWAGYYLFSGLSGLGDWGSEGVFKGVQPAWAWRAALSLAGGVLYVWVCMRWVVRAGVGLVGAGPEAGRALSSLGRTAYFTGGSIAVLIGLLNPKGLVIVLLSAAASSFGGTAGLFSIGAGTPRTGDAPPFELPRRWDWIAAAVLLVGVEAAVLGPTLRF